MEANQMKAIQDLWENSPLSAAQIALRFDTTRSTVIGMAWRKGWKPRKTGIQAYKPQQLARGDSWDPRPTSERLAEFHRGMDALLGLDNTGHWGESGRWISGKKKEPEL